VNGLLQVLDTTLSAPSGHVLDGCLFEVADVVLVDILEGLDRYVLVVGATDLGALD
jgi:hypothetical protein